MDVSDRIRRALDGAGSPDEDVIDELSEHVRAMYERARADGYTNEEADRLVMEQIDRWRQDAGRLRRQPRRVAAVPAPPSTPSSPLDSLKQDTRYAWLRLTRQPRFTLLVVLTMALGLGMATVLFGLTYGVLIRPLPWRDADRIVVLGETRGGNAPRFGSFSSAVYLAWRDQPSTLDAIGAWASQTVTLTGAGDPEHVRVTAGSPSLFRVLGVRPLIGSLFGEGDVHAPVVVLSESLWRQRFGGDPDVVGRTVYFDSSPRTVIGVTPDAVAYPNRLSRAWVPLPVSTSSGSLPMVSAVAKLLSGVTIAQAEAEGATRARGAPDLGATAIAIPQGQS